MTPSFLVNSETRTRKKGMKEMAVFGLRKIFVDPAPRAKKTTPRMQGIMDGSVELPLNWLPE